LSTDNETAIRKLKKLGHTVIVATGRHPQEIIDKLKGNKDICKYVIGANGSLILNQETGEKNFVENITKNDFQEILEEAKIHKGSIIYIKALREDKVMRYKNPHHIFNPSDQNKKDLELPHLSIGIEFSDSKEFKKIVNY
jgi:hydroxymethylpyrimidine pyrophosphatase-like HAD family hydrolase